MIIQVVAGAIRGIYSVFLGISTYKEDIHVIKLLSVFLLLICLLLQKSVSVKNLGRGKTIFPMIQNQTSSYSLSLQWKWIKCPPICLHKTQYLSLSKLLWSCIVIPVFVSLYILSCNISFLREIPRSLPWQNNKLKIKNSTKNSKPAHQHVWAWDVHMKATRGLNPGSLAVDSKKQKSCLTHLEIPARG